MLDFIMQIILLQLKLTFRRKKNQTYKFLECNQIKHAHRFLCKESVENYNLHQIKVNQFFYNILQFFFCSKYAAVVNPARPIAYSRN